MNVHQGYSNVKLYLLLPCNIYNMFLSLIKTKKFLWKKLKYWFHYNSKLLLSPTGPYQVSLLKCIFFLNFYIFWPTLPAAFPRSYFRKYFFFVLPSNGIKRETLLLLCKCHLSLLDWHSLISISTIWQCNWFLYRIGWDWEIRMLAQTWKLLLCPHLSPCITLCTTKGNVFFRVPPS